MRRGCTDPAGRETTYSELVRAGLVEATNGAAKGSYLEKVPPSGAPLPDVLAELVNRLEAQAEELGRLKAITAAAETTSGQERNPAADCSSCPPSRLPCQARGSAVTPRTYAELKGSLILWNTDMSVTVDQ